MNSIWKLMIAGVLAYSALPALAEPKIGFVNVQRLVNESPQAVRAQKRIDEEFKRRDAELQQISRRLRTMQEDLEKNAMTMAETERRNREREFNDLNRDFQRRQREFREDLTQRQNEEMAAIFERANGVIKRIAETERFDLIIQEAVYFSPRIDITDRVIKSLGEAK